MTSIFRRKGRKGWTLRYVDVHGRVRMKQFQDEEHARAYSTIIDFPQAKAEHFELTGERLEAMRRPIVYAWLRGEVTLYVGTSSEGLRRVLNRRHHVLDLAPTDRLQVWVCETAAAALRLEAQMIQKLRPLMNGEPFGRKRM